MFCLIEFIIKVVLEGNNSELLQYRYKNLSLYKTGQKFKQNNYV